MRWGGHEGGSIRTIGGFRLDKSELIDGVRISAIHRPRVPRTPAASLPKMSPVGARRFAEKRNQAPRWRAAAWSISAASWRVVAERDSPRSMRASSSTRASSVVSGVMVVVVRLPVVVLRMVH